MIFLPLILKRATRRLTLLFILILGVVLATGLLASAPILIDTVIEFGLPRRLKAANRTDPLSANVYLTTYANLGETDYQLIDDGIQTTLQTNLGENLKQIALIIQTHWMYPWIENTPFNTERINFRYIEAIEDKIEIVEGAWPATPPDEALNSQTTVFGVISEEMAVYYELRAGSQIPLSLALDAHEPDLIVTVSGIVRPLNASDPFWMGQNSPLKSQGNQRYDEQFGVLLPAETFFIVAQQFFSRSRSELAWHVLIEPDTVTTTRLPALINRLTELPGAFDKTVAVESGMRDLLLDFYSQTQDIRTPIYLLTAEIVLLALAYVGMTAGQHIRTIESEFVTLRSRGASGGQIIRIQLAEALLIAAIAIMIGPGLGAQFVVIIESFGPLADLPENQTLLTSSQAAWTAAIVGAGACIIGLLTPVFPALQRSIVTHAQATGRQSKPFWQRVYLDVALLVLGLILLYRLEVVGGIGAGSGNRVDWLLLLSPLALLLGAATLIVRLTPLILSIVSRIVSLGRGLPAPLAFWQTARNPTQFAGIVLLLTLANALGILSVGLNTTLDKSEVERSRYAVGGDVRLGTETGLTGIYNLAAVANASVVMRTSGKVDLKTYRSYPAFNLLAIDPVSFSKVTVYRNDFSEEPMGELLGKLLTPRHRFPGLDLPGKPAQIGVWVYANPMANTFLDENSDRDRVKFTIKLLTHAGVSILLTMEDENPACPDKLNDGIEEDAEECVPPSWAYLTAEIPELSTIDYPLSVHSIWMQNRARLDGSLVGAVNLTIGMDDFGVTDRQTGETTIVEDFEDILQIVSHEFRSKQVEATSRFSYTKLRAYNGNASGDFLLSFNRVLQSTGLIFNIANRENPILPAVVSPKFLEVTGLSVGEFVNVTIQEQPLIFEIKGVTTYFPTMYEDQEAGFLLTSSEALILRLGNETQKAINPNEIWLDLAPGYDLTDIPTNEATNIWDKAILRQVMKADPLALGMRSVTFLGYLLTTLLSIIGFASHFTLSVRQRSTSFGILRAMGLSPAQLYASLALEQSLIILTGLGLGAVLGAVLNQIVLSGLPITLANQVPIPPFIPATNWEPIRQVFTNLFIVFALTFGIATWALWRGKVHQALRIGQE